jgi:hypothetical protein
MLGVLKCYAFLIMIVNLMKQTHENYILNSLNEVPFVLFL